MKQNESQPPRNLSISRTLSETWSKHGRTGFSLFPPRRRTVSMVFLRGNTQPDRKRRVILAEATDASHAAILIAIPINWCSCNTRVLSLMRDSDKSTRGSWHPKSASVRPIREAEVSLLATRARCYKLERSVFAQCVPTYTQRTIHESTDFGSC